MPIQDHSESPVAAEVSRHTPRRTPTDDGWLIDVAARASKDAGDVPVELLGDHLTLLADAAITGRRPRRAELDAVETLGRTAAQQGVSAGRVVQLYLSAARRLWQDLPAVVRSRDREAVRAAAAAVLHVIDDAVATLAEGYAVARRDLVRREETMRRDLIDDLLRGDSDLGGLVDRAEPFGLDLARVHQVALAAYFDTGAVATETAKRVHVSVRAVTYRLHRMKQLTGYDPADPAHRFTLQAAVLGARALNWPQAPLPTPS